MVLGGRPLPLRKTQDLTSDKCGILTPGQTVLVMETCTLDDGMTCARVGRMSSPRGLLVDPLGWVMTTKHGSPDQPLLRTLSTDEELDADWRLQYDEYNERKDRDSMASRIAQRRWMRRSPNLGSKWFSYAEQAELIMPELIAQGAIRAPSPPPESAAQARARRRAETGAEDHAGSLAGAAGAAIGLVRGTFAGPAEQHEVWMDAPALDRYAALLWKESRTVETVCFEAFAERCLARMEPGSPQCVTDGPLMSPRLFRMKFAAGCGCAERPARCPAVAVAGWV